MTTQELALLVAGLGLSVTIIWNIYQATVGRQKTNQELADRITALEVKVGLFWHTVESNMGSMLAKSNPINLTDEEQVAAKCYEIHTSECPTDVLVMLNTAIAREVSKGYMHPNEVMMFTLIQSAIKAQLVDRKEL